MPPPTSQALLERVRANIQEPAQTVDPLRTDNELAQYLQDSQLDYISKIPADAIPELVTDVTATGTSWTRTADFLKLLNLIVSHTLSGSLTRQEEASILSVDESYYALYYPDGNMGCWGQWRQDILAFGPNAYQATVRYLRVPTDISDPCATFELDVEHEEPIVNRATAMALSKVNDVDAKYYLDLYDSRVNAEQQRYPTPLRVEKTPNRTEE